MAGAASFRVDTTAEIFLDRISDYLKQQMWPAFRNGGWRIDRDPNEAYLVVHRTGSRGAGPLISVDVEALKPQQSRVVAECHQANLEPLLDEVLDYVSRAWVIHEFNVEEGSPAGDESRLDLPCGLDGRDRMIVRHYLNGQTDREIADQLFVSPKTISNRLSHLRKDHPELLPSRRQLRIRE